MSNPAVIKLQSGKIGQSKFWMDDNFGESIHIHIDDFRVDLSVNEFKQLYEDTCIALTRLIDIDNFDVRKMDPVFLSVMLWPKLSKLERVSFDKVKLGDLMAPYHSRIYKLSESVGVRSLQGLSNEGDGYRKSHHIGQTEAMRMNSIMNSLKENGYPYNDNYIVLYGDDNIIRDGQHRASCLYVLYGDIEIPVLRLHLIDYKSPRFNRFNNTIIMLFYKSQRENLISHGKKALVLAKKIRKILLRYKPSFKIKKKDTINPDLERLFASK